MIDVPIIRSQLNRWNSDKSTGLLPSTWAGPVERFIKICGDDPLACSCINTCLERLLIRQMKELKRIYDLKKAQTLSMIDCRHKMLELDFH